MPCPGGCSGNGKCDRGRCLCSIGFEGADCSKKSTCPNDCNKHGVCSVGGTCLCEPGYAGEACEYSPGCGDKICDNGGLCRDGVCLCPNGFTGDTCSRLVPGASTTRPKCPKDGNGVVCGGHGVCPEGERACKCEDGWSGDTCTEAEMPAGTRWTRPEGGYQTWVELPPIDTTGWTSVTISMDAHFRKNEAPCEFMDLQYWDGAAWVSFGVVTAHAWSNYSFTLPAGAMGDPALGIRMITNA